MVAFLLLIKFTGIRNNKSEDFRSFVIFCWTVPTAQYIISNMTIPVVFVLKLKYGSQVLSVSFADFVRDYYRSGSKPRSPTGGR